MSTPSLPYRPHNHKRCVQQAMADAREVCRRANARLTPIRERVLELVWQSHKPLGAYELLASLAKDGHNAAPPTVYRALDFLLQHGLVHRIASLNAFTGCSHAGEQHTGLFLICDQCQNVLELEAPAVFQAVDSLTKAEGFQTHDATIEVSGRCPACLDSPRRD